MINRKWKALIIIMAISIIILVIISYNWNTHIYAYRLTSSIRDGNTQRLEKLLENKDGDVNCKPYIFEPIVDRMEISNLYPIEEACNKCDYNITKLLIDAGANVNITDSSIGRTPLTIVLSKYSSARFKVANLLIKKGADIDKKDYFDNAPISLATNNSSENPNKSKKEGAALEKYLLRHCKNIEKETYTLKRDLLEEACTNNNLEIVEYLIENGYFSIKASEKGNTTPLISAVQNDAYETCEYLLRNGADSKSKDSKGRTAYDYAKENGNKKIMKLIRKYGQADRR